MRARRLFELLRRLAVLAEILLRLLLGIGQLALELFDVGRLERRRLAAFRPRPRRAPTKRRSTTFTGTSYSSAIGLCDLSVVMCGGSGLALTHCGAKVNVSCSPASLDRHRSSRLQRAEQDLVGQSVADFGLAHAPERARPEHGIVALPGQILPPRRAAA
jgi:hypothetical protein